MARRRNSNSGVYSKKDYMNRQENRDVYSRDDYMRQRATRIDPARVNDIQEGAEALRLDIMRRQQSQAMTNAWKNMSQQATYSPAGDQRGLAYAEKMKYDTMGREAYLQDLENQRRNQQTYMTQRQPIEELQAEKRWSKEQARREQEQKEWDAYVQAQYNTTHDAMRDIKKETGGSSTGAPLTIKDFQAWRARQQADRESGALDKGNDPWNVSDKGLPDWIKRNQKAADEYSITPGQLWADVMEYADDVKANRELRQRPADYTDSRDVYDKYLYNSINGEGAYEKRTDEIETDAEADALDAELDELWARYERGELPKYIRNINDSELYDSVNGKGAYNKRLNEISTFGVPKKINEGSEALSREMDDLWGQYARGELTDENAAALVEERENNRKKNTDAGDRYFDFGTDYNDWASMTPEKRRETLWMEMMGTDYAAALEGMTDAQKAEMNRRMDLIMDKAMQGKTKDFNAAADAYSNLVKQGEAAQEYRNKIKDLDIQAEGLEAQGYTGESVPAMLEANKPKYVSDPEDTEGMLRLDRIWSNTEKAMYLMNYKKNLDGTGDLYSDANKYMFANEDQIKQANIFYEYDQKNGTHMTEAFLEGIDSYLTSELAKYQEEYARSLADDAFRGSVARVASYAAKPITGLVGAVGTGLSALGVEGAKDTTGDFFKYDKLINVLREQGNENAADWTAKTFGEEWRDRTTFVLGVVDSIADNLMAMAMGSKMAGVSAATRTEQNVERSMRLVQLIMSAEATSSTMIEKLDSGMDGTEAAVYSVGDGIIEWLTERYSLEQILKPDVKAMLGKPKQLISFLAKSSAAEGSEEIASDLLNLGLDSVVSYIAGHEDEIRSRVNDYIVNEHMTASEAEKRVLKEKLGEIAQSGLAGALSGLGMAGGRTIANKFNQVQAGRNVRNENGGLQKIIDLAKGMEEGTESRALAEKLAGQKKVSNGELGRLSQLIITESSEERGEVIRGTVYRNVAEDLKAAGVENASQAAEVITRNLTEGNEKLSRADMKVLAQSEGAINVWKDYNTTGSLNTLKTNLDIRKNTQGVDETIETVSVLSSDARSVAENLTGKKNRKLDGGIHLASYDEIQEAERNGAKRINGKREVLYNGQFARLDGVRVVKEGDRYKLKLSVNGKEISASDLQATDYGTAQIIQSAVITPEFFTERFINQLMEANEKGRLKSDDILDDLKEASIVRLAGYTGTAMPQTKLEAQLANEIWMDSQKEHAENRKSQVAEANRKESGTVSFDGAEYGTNEYNEKVKKLDSQVRDKLDYVAGIAQRAGVDARFTDLNDSDTTTYGWENRKGIGINIGGLDYGVIDGKATPTGKHDIVVTFGHELTHWMQRNSLAGYNRLEQYIMNQLVQKRGLKGLRERLDYFMLQEGLSLEDAMSEIVANSCDQILGDEQVAKHIQKTDGKLHTQIKNFVKDLVDRMKKAITGTGMKDSMSKDARMILANGINDLRKNWLGAWDDALSRVAENHAQTTEETERLSKVGKDKESLRTLYISNFAPNTPSAIKSQRIIDLIQNVWSKKPIRIKVYDNNSDGRYIDAQFDPYFDPTGAIKTDVGKLAFGNRQGTNAERRVTLNLADDYKSILEEAKYRTFEKERKAHQGVKKWYYFTDDIYYADQGSDIAIPYTIEIDIKENNDGHFVYTYFARENTNEQRKKLSLMDLVSVNTRVMSGESATASDESIARKAQEDNTRKSTAEMDDMYEQAYNTYDDEWGEQLVAEAAEMAMPDSKIRDENGKLKVVYHQTNAVDEEGNPFTVFNMERARHTSDVVGAFFAPEYDQYHEYGDRTYAAYLNIKNPAYDVYVDNSITDAGLLKRNELIAQGYDGIINTEDGKPYEYVAFYPEQIKSAEAFTEDDDGDLIPLSLRFNDYKEDIRWSRAETKNNEGAPGGSMVDDIDNMEQAVSPSVDNINETDDTVKMDREYEAAVKRGDIRTATEMLMDKLRKTKGVIPFMAPEWDTGKYRETAKNLKTGDPEAIATAAKEMSKYVPENAVLIPMPGRSGKLSNDSWTVKLANAIGERTGRPVVIALEGTEHESRQEAKRRGELGASQEELGFHQVSEIPEGTFPIFVDNVIGKGITADAARKAMGGGITLAYTKTLRSPGIVGLKNAVITYESEKKGGGLIPLSERFNINKRDVRYSRAEEALDAGVWMANLTPSAVQTEDERVLIQAYKDKRISMSLCLKRQIDYKAKIRELEGKETLTAEQRTELNNLQSKLKTQQKKMETLQAEMAEITSTEGYAGMMYRHNMVLQDFVQGRTSEQVQETVEAMLKEVRAAQEQIARQAEELKKLEQTQAVKTMKSFLGKTSLDQQAAMLRKQYSSAMNKAEISDRLAQMALKLASGQDIQADAEALAADLVDKIRGIRSENLESLRGITLNIGENLLKELKAENSSLKEIRTAIYGSGVKIKTEGNSRLVEQWNELREHNQALPDVDGMAEIDALHTIADFISGELQASSGGEQYNVNMEEATAICYGAAASVTTYVVKDPTARKQIIDLTKQIRDLSQRTGSIAESMDVLNAKMQDVVAAGYKAADWSGILHSDVNTAIDYYNKVARQAAQEEKAQVKKNLIEQLRSENAKKLYALQDEYNEKIRNTRKAREMMEDNLALRKKVNTSISRLKNMLTAETDQKNIPEETKQLARYLCGKIVNNDMSGVRRVLFANEKQLQDFHERLKRMEAQDGAFDAERDLDWLVIKAPNAEDNDTTMRDKIIADLRYVDNALMMYWTAEGNGLNSLNDRRDALKELQKAVGEIYSVIRARGQAFVNGKRYEVAELAERMEDEMSRSRFKGERKGYGSRQANAVEKALKFGNLTPEYFFKNLKNSVMSLLHDGFHNAENRSGLLAAEAQEKIKTIADSTGFNTWDGKEKHKVKVSGGRTVEMTTEQIMSLYATWRREKNGLRPEETAHLLKGGFVLAQEENNKGKPGREKVQQHPIRMTEEQLNSLRDYMTTEQRDYVERIVEYMSTDLAEIGNEASMEAYGIRKFTEKYYFPIKSWGGVLNQDSARGIVNQNDNRAMRQSFTKRITAGAQNAIEISDFTPTAMKHIVGMITFNTVGPAVENLNKVLNQKLSYGDVSYGEDGAIDEDNRYKRSVRAAFQEAYGKNAADYLAQFMLDVNGGVTQRPENSLRETLLSLFKKNAVAGSLSVAAQQPLSYIRAAMMINPKYLAQALSPQYWKGSNAEMLKYSGVAVIKGMGRFDMNFGRSMIDYITPEAKQTNRARAVYEAISEKSTALPEKMDAMTWTRMWTAVKLEQAAQQPGVNMKDDAFLKRVAERFNEVMRRTQVYDSVMVKSQNMRSTSYLKKVTTSFMAEPTLSLNVLADAWQNRKEQGGKANAVKALVTFVLSAAAQAGAKGLFGAGRSPDKKKNKEENFYYKFAMSLLSEMNPLGLIPGYSQMMDVLMKGELNDDAMGVIGKATQAFDAVFELATGKVGDKGLYRKLEDSIGQTVQFATKVPLKNFMRDFRAMVNWFSGGRAQALTGDSYAQRPTSNAVMKYQTLDALMSDDIIGLVNMKLGEAGYGTSNTEYTKRIYAAEAAGNKAQAEELTEYVLQGKGMKEETLQTNLRGMAKKDDSLDAEARIRIVTENSTASGSSDYVISQLKEGQITDIQARKMIRELFPEKSEDDVYWQVDRAKYQAETGKEKVSGNYYRLVDAVNENKAAEIQKAVKDLLDHGISREKIKGKLSDWKSEYLEADSRQRIRIRDALEKAYKTLGYTVADADKVIDGWLKDTKKTTEKKDGGKKQTNQDTTGQWGRGNINLNKRQVVHNSDGTISTERSFSVNIDGKEVLLPTVIDGKIVSEEEAIRHYEKTGQYLGKFNTVKEAEEYAEKLHKRQEWYYSNNK